MGVSGSEAVDDISDFGKVITVDGFEGEEFFWCHRVSQWRSFF